LVYSIIFHTIILYTPMVKFSNFSKTFLHLIEILCTIFFNWSGDLRRTRSTLGNWMCVCRCSNRRPFRSSLIIEDFSVCLQTHRAGLHKHSLWECLRVRNFESIKWIIGTHIQFFNFYNEERWNLSALSFWVIEGREWGEGLWFSVTILFWFGNWTVTFKATLNTRHGIVNLWLICIDTARLSTILKGKLLEHYNSYHDGEFGRHRNGFAILAVVALPFLCY